MSDETDRHSIVDDEHLKLLSLAYMVSGGVAALFALLGLLYVFMGIVMALSFRNAPVTPSNPYQQPPAFIGWVFAGVGAVIVLGAIALAFAKFRVAADLRQRKSRKFCMVIAAIGCLEFPYGTLLGVLSFLVLGRDSVTRLFTPSAPGAGAAR